jgi:hypothetical protein
MIDLNFTLLTDGPSDEVLLRHLEWLAREHVKPELAIQPEWADLRSLDPKPAGLANRIRATLELFPCDLLFVHRDAEREDPQHRHNEIQRAVDSLGPLPVSVISVVRVRMQEAWLLVDESAIRRAAGNPSGRHDLALPGISSIEDISDPKHILRECLRKASGLRGRRLRKFRTSHAARLVAEYIEDFSPLRNLPAFQRLETEVQNEIQRRGWG